MTAITPIPVIERGSAEPCDSRTTEPTNGRKLVRGDSSVTRQAPCEPRHRQDLSGSLESSNRAVGRREHIREWASHQPALSQRHRRPSPTFVPWLPLLPRSSPAPEDAITSLFQPPPPLRLRPAHKRRGLRKHFRRQTGRDLPCAHVGPAQERGRDTLEARGQGVGLRVWHESRSAHAH